MREILTRASTRHVLTIFNGRDPGASAGFGEALTRIVLSRGDRVIATARSIEKIKHLESPSCKTFQLDVTDNFDSIQAVAKEAVTVWGRVDVLVNNAGIGTAGICEEIGQVIIS